MHGKPAKGFSVMELLIVTAVIFIITAIAIPNILNSLRSLNFKESFGIEIGKNQLNNEERQIIQPLVTKRLQDFRNNLQTAQKEKADLLALPGSAIPEEVIQRRSKLIEIGNKITSATGALNKAEISAKYFGFKI